MKSALRLSEIVEVLEYPEEWECLLDRNTLNIITITENEEPYLEDGEDELADLPDWQRDNILDVRRALAAADPIPLPTRFDVHEWEIMRRFSDSQEQQAARQELGDAIRGSGAFRLFRHTIDRLGLRESWFSYRDDAFRQIARDWLNEHGIPFTED